MAGQDPRRSSRARGTQSQSQHSSTTSSTSGRAERSTRFNKNGSPQKSTPTGSLSSEPPEDTIHADFSARRRTRGNGEDRDKVSSNLDLADMANGDDDIQDEDEAVRCICGYDDYPGPPPFEEDSKHGIKDTVDLDPIFTTDVNDDTAGFFVQCDICKVWQHGACVGIMTEESSPDEYFCEQCRKEFHKIFTASNGQRYSHYLPLKRQQSIATSRAGSIIKDGAKSPRESERRSGRKSSESQTMKRRSTMNSRDAAYDEAEALRRAIEASKEDAGTDEPAGEVPIRRTKRGRSDSEEKPENPKRQRTSSGSVSPPPDKDTADESDEAPSTMRNGSKTKSRAVAVTSRSTRSEKPADKDERERQRAEAANKRKGRAERRRIDGTPTCSNPSTILVEASEAYNEADSDPAEEMPLAVRTTVTRAAVVPVPPPKPVANPTPPDEKEKPKPAPVVIETPIPTPIEQPSPETPSLPDPAPPPPPTVPRNDRKRSHKKKGRNQYTRDRDDDSPARSQSRDIARDDNGTPNGRGEGHSGRQSKAKGGMNSRITMTDMKRRATALLDFISRTQVELAGETAASATDSKGENKVNGARVNGDSSSARNPLPKQLPKPMVLSYHGTSRDFKELSCMEMMDSLTRRLVKWQQEYTA